MEFAPFWQADATRPADLTTVEDLPGEADVLIVGAGFTGLHAAREIALAGTASVVVIDAVGVGGGASSINGGMVNYGLKAGAADVFEMYGPKLGREFWDLSLESINHVERVVGEEGIECNFNRPGSASLGFTERDLANFRAQQAWMAEKIEFPVDVHGPDSVRSVVDSPLFHAAKVEKVGAGLHPAKYVYGMGAAVARRGVTPVDGVKAVAIEHHGGGFAIKTSRGVIRAGQVLMATNGYTEAKPIKALRRRVIPVGSYIVVTEQLPVDLATSLIPDDRMCWTHRRFLNYFRRTPDHRMLMGGRQNLSTTLDLGESAKILATRTKEIFPQLDGYEIEYSWTGKLGVTFDLMPHIGKLDGVWYALGYGGHGVGIASLVGSHVGRLIAGTAERSAFAEIPHPTRLYYRDRTWFLPFAAPLYRTLDRLGR